MKWYNYVIMYSINVPKDQSTSSIVYVMKVAVCGCIHGQFNVVYDAILATQPNPDLVLMCGDIQAARNPSDLEYMSVPPKYRQLGDFHEYFEGRRQAPILTIVIGGNHEASSYMSSLKDGGWLAPNIYYLGDMGVIAVAGLKICGISGIYFKPDANKPRIEHQQFANQLVDPESIYSVYHTRSKEVKELSKFLSTYEPIDIMMTHDWPRGIENFGDSTDLFHKKRHLKPDSLNGKLGNPLTAKLLKFDFKYWLSAHLHVKFRAQYQNTQFLALGKVTKYNDYLEVLEIDTPAEHSGNSTDSNFNSNLKITKIF